MQLRLAHQRDQVEFYQTIPSWIWRHLDTLRAKIWEMIRGNEVVYFFFFKGVKVVLFITGWDRGVLITLGATALALMPSFAHSHAKCFASWFRAPVKTFMWNQQKKTQTLLVDYWILPLIVLWLPFARLQIDPDSIDTTPATEEMKIILP